MLPAKSKFIKLLLWALVPVSLWASAMKAIGLLYGFHSTPAIWGAYIGLPGMAIGGGILYLTSSETTFYLGAFLGNWLFCFGTLKAALALKGRLARSREMDDRIKDGK